MREPLKKKVKVVEVVESRGKSWKVVEVVESRGSCGKSWNLIQFFEKSWKSPGSGINEGNVLENSKNSPGFSTKFFCGSLGILPWLFIVYTHV